jgi:hypothetical protein
MGVLSGGPGASEADRRPGPMIREAETSGKGLGIRLPIVGAPTKRPSRTSP